MITISININEYAKKAYEYYVSCGMTPQGACGLMGNQYSESAGFIANRVEFLCIKRLKENGKSYTDESYTKAVDTGAISKAGFLNPLPNRQYGYGLSQWTSPSRKSELYDLTVAKGFSIANEQKQLEFTVYEMKNKYQSVWKILTTTNSVKTASDYVLHYYECPDNWQSLSATRADYGNQYYNYFSKLNNSATQNGSDNMANVTEKAIQWMEKAANDSSHGYDQAYRWGEKGDYDCSSAVITAWQNAGVPVKTKGATYTGNMYNVFLACGFKDVTKSVNISNGSGLVRGDVLLNHSKHVAMYCGNGKEVEASINEKGTATGGKPGDQTGKEFLIRSYRNYPWNVVLRYSGSGASSGGSSSSTTTKTYLQKGDSGNDVKTMQKMLIAIGYSCGSCGADGDFGNDTLKALKKFQTDFNLEVDGYYGANSKAKLESEYNKKTSNNNSNNASNNKKVDSAQYYDKSLAGTYKVKTALYIRCGAGKETPSLDVMEKGAKVQCYGYYSVASDGVKWLYVVYKGITGFASSTYLKKA